MRCVKPVECSLKLRVWSLTLWVETSSWWPVFHCQVCMGTDLLVREGRVCPQANALVDHLVFTQALRRHLQLKKRLSASQNDGCSFSNLKRHGVEMNDDEWRLWQPGQCDIVQQDRPKMLRCTDSCADGVAWSNIFAYLVRLLCRPLGFVKASGSIIMGNQPSRGDPIGGQEKLWNIWLLLITWGNTSLDKSMKYDESIMCELDRLNVVGYVLVVWLLNAWIYRSAKTNKKSTGPCCASAWFFPDLTSLL